MNADVRKNIDVTVRARNLDWILNDMVFISLCVVLVGGYISAMKRHRGKQVARASLAKLLGNPEKFILEQKETKKTKVLEKTLNRRLFVES
jgi:hypothetical protein